MSTASYHSSVGVRPHSLEVQRGRALLEIAHDMADLVKVDFLLRAQIFRAGHFCPPAGKRPARGSGLRSRARRRRPSGQSSLSACRLFRGGTCHWQPALSTRRHETHGDARRHSVPGSGGGSCPPTGYTPLLPRRLNNKKSARQSPIYTHDPSHRTHRYHGAPRTELSPVAGHKLPQHGIDRPGLLDVLLRNADFVTRHVALRDRARKRRLLPWRGQPLQSPSSAIPPVIQWDSVIKRKAGSSISIPEGDVVLALALQVGQRQALLAGEIRKSGCTLSYTSASWRPAAQEHGRYIHALLLGLEQAVAGIHPGFPVAVLIAHPGGKELVGQRAVPPLKRSVTSMAARTSRFWKTCRASEARWCMRHSRPWRCRRSRYPPAGWTGRAASAA